MSCNHAVSDLVTRIKNASIAKKSSTSSPFSSLRESVLHILKEEGYILNYTKIPGVNGVSSLEIHLKYANSVSVINEISVISKPGGRVYRGVDNLAPVRNGLGVLVISTSQGILSDYEAKRRNLGGEVLFKIF